jgi:hypothetical protein
MAEAAKLGAAACVGQEWIEQELAAATLPDARLQKRLQHLVEQMAAGLGRSIPPGMSGLGGHKGHLPVFLQRADL